MTGENGNGMGNGKMNGNGVNGHANGNGASVNGGNGASVAGSVGSTEKKPGMMQRAFSRKNLVSNISATSLSPAEAKLKQAKELGMDAPINLTEVWSVERGLTEMQHWPEKLGGYRELMFFMFFYIIFCLVQILQANPGAAFAVNWGLTNVVSGYDTVASQSDWWAYTSGLLSIIFTPTWYNGDTFTTDDSGYIQYYNKLVGGVLIYQRRGVDADCKTSLYNVFYGTCHSETPEVGNFTTGSTSLPATFGYDPEQNGYSAFFSVALTQQQALAQFATLQQNRWLDKNTREVTIKFAVYNGEYQLFTFAAIDMTYGIGGVMFGANKATIQSAQFEIYKTQDDWARLVLEIIFMYLAAWLLSDEMIDLVKTLTSPTMGPDGKMGFSLLRGFKAYVRSMWNYVDLLNHGLAFTYIAKRIEYVVYIIQNPIKLPTNQYQQELETVAGLNTDLLLIISFNLFVKILHVFKYFSFQPRMNILSSTVARALPDLFHFFILFGCVFISYCVIAMLLFGPQVQQYFSFGWVSETLGEIIIGNVDYATIHAINPLMATLMMWSFILLVVFVLVNVFLAILIDAYAVAKAESAGATGIPEDIGRVIISALSKKPEGTRGDPLREALKFFQERGVAAIETADIEWFLKEQYGVTDQKFLLKNEGLLRAMQCRVDKDDPNCEMNTLLHAAWATYDTDGSGFLDREEFAAFLRDAPVKTSAETEERLDALIAQADTNGDGLVSFDEFVPIFHAVMLEGLASTARKELEAARGKSSIAR